MHKRLAPRSVGMDPIASVAMYGWLLKQNPVPSKKNADNSDLSS